jgi:hypothetical protein
MTVTVAIAKIIQINFFIFPLLLLDCQLCLTYIIHNVAGLSITGYSLLFCLLFLCELNASKMTTTGRYQAAVY